MQNLDYLLNFAHDYNIHTPMYKLSDYDYESWVQDSEDRATVRKIQLFTEMKGGEIREFSEDAWLINRTIKANFKGTR